MMKKMLFLAAGLAVASLNVRAAGDDCNWLCDVKNTASDFAKGAEGLATDVYDWTANGWDVAGNKISGANDALHNVDLNQKWSSLYHYGTDSANPAWGNAVIQGGKFYGAYVGAAVLTVVGLWTLYKAGKISLSAFRAFCNSSKKAKLATVLALGTAVAVAPSTVIAAYSAYAH